MDKLGKLRKQILVAIEFPELDPTLKPEIALAMLKIIEHVKGLSFGVDWNSGTHAASHREPLLKSLAEFEDILK
jgi:hypothetical protein